MVSKYMKRAAILSFLILAGILCSCEKFDRPGEQAASQKELDNLYKAYESLVELYPEKNRFKESLICNDWVLAKVTRETYVDGALVQTTDATGYWGKMEFSFRKNHRMSYSGSNGVWMYSHNLLLWVYDGNYHSYEVVGAKAGVLQLKAEEYPAGIPWTPFIIEKSGEHYFYIFEYHAK